MAEGDSREAIHGATVELVKAIIEANGIDSDDLASAFFTTTPDLHAAFPAEAARLMGGSTCRCWAGRDGQARGSCPLHKGDAPLEYRQEADERSSTST